MKSWLKKLSVAIVVCVAFSAVSFAAGPHVHAYWALQKEYVSALESGNETAIVNAASKIVELYNNPANADQYSAAAWPCEKAAKIYEKQGDIDNAKKYYKKFLEYVTYLDNNGADYKDSIKITKAVLNHLEDAPRLYTDARYPADEKFFGAKWEPHNKTYFGTSSDFRSGAESATLIYIEFPGEDISTFSYKVPTDTAVPIDFAWNISSESFDMLSQVANGSYDSYIIKNMQYLATVRNPVFLRFASEVNCWKTLPGSRGEMSRYTEIYKNAFIRVSTLAKQYAPNVAMVYSPNDVSNWNTSAKEFYPGDEYVDWIGVSVYCNLSRSSAYEPGDANDLFYFTGLYDNPILKIKEFTQISDKKPLMISECGCGYAPEEGQTREHAAKMINFLYSYVNMVYPQIKMIFYFDTNVEHKYRISDDSMLYSVYQQAVADNILMQASLGKTVGGYTRFSTLNETRDYIDLYTYAAFPLKDEVSVAYNIDGVGIPSGQTAPYKAVIDVASLTTGKHTLSLAVACGKAYKTYNYDFYVGENNFVSTRPLETDIGVTVNGGRVYFDTQPQIQNGRTLVPLRAIFEALGAGVSWDGATQTVTAQKGNTQIKMTIGNGTFFVNGQNKTLEVPPVIADGRTLVPVRAIGESFGCNVGWNQETRLVTVTE